MLVSFYSLSVTGGTHFYRAEETTVIIADFMDKFIGTRGGLIRSSGIQIQLQI